MKESFVFIVEKGEKDEITEYNQFFIKEIRKVRWYDRIYAWVSRFFQHKPIITNVDLFKLVGENNIVELTVVPSKQIQNTIWEQETQKLKETVF